MTKPGPQRAYDSIEFTAVFRCHKKNVIYARGGQLIWPGVHFEKSGFSRGSYHLMEIKASLG